MRKYFGFIFLILIGTHGYQANAALLGDVLVSGNIKTRDEIIQQEMLILHGTEITPLGLAQSRQAIMDLGLFEKVEISVEEGTEQAENATPVNTNDVVVTVKEKKHDWYILPRIDRSGDGDIALGINLRANNRRGLNQTSKLTIKTKKFKDASLDEEKSIKWSLDYPRIVNTRYSAFFEVEGKQIGLDEDRNNQRGVYDREQILLGASIGRWFSPFGASKGLHASLGLEYNNFSHEFLGGDEGLFDNAEFISLISRVSYRQVEDHLFSLDGFELGLSLKRAFKSLGSKREFFKQYLFYRSYNPLSYRAHTNFNFQVQVANGDRSLFGGPIYELSGKQTLRGYPRETLEGDAFFLVNTEFLTPIGQKDNLRAVAFVDFGNAYDRFSDVTSTDMEAGIGVGLRWKFKRWVGTELRIDIARGLGDQGETRVYAASEATF